MTANADQMSPYIHRVVRQYTTFFPNESRRHAMLLDWLRENYSELTNRRNCGGHVTVSSLILHSSSQSILLIQHPVLRLWVPPGGHMECGELLTEACLREATEETGVPDLCLHPWHSETDIPIDIGTHFIPANEAKGEARHPHFDFRYVFTTDYRHETCSGECGTGRWVELSSSFLKDRTDLAEVGDKIVAYCTPLG